MEIEFFVNVQDSSYQRNSQHDKYSICCEYPTQNRIQQAFTEILDPL